MNNTTKPKIEFKSGTLRNSIRAYRKHKKEWQARMDIKLTQMEEEIKTELILDEGIENFIAIIVSRNHPYLEEKINHFNKEIEMFQEGKPRACLLVC